MEVQVYVVGTLLSLASGSMKGCKAQQTNNDPKLYVDMENMLSGKDINDKYNRSVKNNLIKILQRGQR